MQQSVTTEDMKDRYWVTACNLFRGWFSCRLSVHSPVLYLYKEFISDLQTCLSPHGQSLNVSTRQSLCAYLRDLVTLMLLYYPHFPLLHWPPSPVASAAGLSSTSGLFAPSAPPLPWFRVSTSHFIPFIINLFNMQLLSTYSVAGNDIGAGS